MTGREFLRTEDVYAFERYIRMTPFALLSSALVFTLSLPGLILSLRTPRRFLLAYAFLFGESFIFFFQMKTHYLMPAMPFVMIFSAFCLLTLCADIRRKNWKTVGLALCLIGLTSLLASFIPLGLRDPGRAETYYAIGKNFRMRRNNREAEKMYRLSLALNPAGMSVLNDLGVVFMEEGRYEKALRCFERASFLDPQAVRPRKNIELCRRLMQSSPLKKGIR